MLIKKLQKIWKPEIYQGHKWMKGYFEGWYYKIADRNERFIGAIIPGVSFDKKGSNSHCFVQFLENSGSLGHYYVYDIEEFSYSPGHPEIRIGDSVFSLDKIEVNINDESSTIEGTLLFRDLKQWPVTMFSPGAMGWYAFVPLMECYHGVLSFDHLIEGQLDINGKALDLSGGKGYIEKDWGRSFPSYHIWMQTNHFKKPGTSLMVSIANIPWLCRSFDGFLVGFLYNGRLYRFTTYTGAKISRFTYEQDNLVIHVKSKAYRLEMEVHYKAGIELRTPVLGEMRGRLSESLSAETSVRFFSISNGINSLIYSDIGRHVGLEIEGNIPEKLNQ